MFAESSSAAKTATAAPVLTQSRTPANKACKDRHARSLFTESLVGNAPESLRKRNEVRAVWTDALCVVSGSAEQFGEPS
jgi:hypothetical protein